MATLAGAADEELTALTANFSAITGAGVAAGAEPGGTVTYTSTMCSSTISLPSI